MKCLNCKKTEEDCGNFGGCFYTLNNNKKGSFICNKCLKIGVLSRNEEGNIKKTNKLTKKDKLNYKPFYGSSLINLNEL
jgi:hypothetical protein